MNKEFDRFKLLIGNENFNKIKNLNILLVGVGGVGSFTFESLVRSGIENITIVDYDTIDITNLNRQLMTNKNNIGLKKVDVLKERALSINENINLKTIDLFLDKKNIDEIFKEKYDFVIDACDTVETKKLIIKKCIENKIKFITCMGTGNKMDPTKLEIIDIRKTSYDPLSKIIRKWVKDENVKEKIYCLSSTEKPLKLEGNIIGSNSFVPSTAGLIITSYIINNIIKRNN